jgi:hypothetical protein
VQDAQHFYELAPDAVGHQVRRPVNDELARPRAPTGTPTVGKLERTGDRRKDELHLALGGGEIILRDAGAQRGKVGSE